MIKQAEIAEQQIHEGQSIIAPEQLNGFVQIVEQKKESFNGKG